MHIPGMNVPKIAPIELPEYDGLSSSAPKDTAFGDVLSSAINEVEGARSDAKESVENFLAGNGDDLHSTILTTQRAELEFQMFMQVRNKVVNAYQEIMKMQI